VAGSKLANVNVWFGDCNSPLLFPREILDASQSFAVIDCCGELPLGARMHPSNRDTVVVKVMGFEDKPGVGVAPLFAFVLVPIILELLKRGYYVLVNCRKGANRLEPCLS
jgi:hypothetical protein